MDEARTGYNQVGMPGQVPGAPASLPTEKASVMLHFEGDRNFALAPEAAWTRLSDARFLVQCIPDSEPTGSPEPGQATCKVRPGFAFVRGTLDVTLQVAEATAPASVRLLLHSKGIGSSSDVEVTFTLAAHEGGTRAHWDADIKHLGGLLKAVPSGLIRAAAQKVIGDVWASVETKLAAEA
jgi:carbon monoxide dehydrogenase subunit G